LDLDAIKDIERPVYGAAARQRGRKKGAETRTMIPKPIFEYNDPETKLPIGAIFGMSATDTTRADFEKVGNSVISRIGDPSMRKRTGISLTADEPQIRNVIS
jgi:hypothetical protein